MCFNIFYLLIKGMRLTSYDTMITSEETSYYVERQPRFDRDQENSTIQDPRRWCCLVRQGSSVDRFSVVGVVCA